MEVTDNYTNVRIDTAPFPLYLRTKNRGIGKARAKATIKVSDGINTHDLYQVSSANNAENTFNIPALTYNFTTVPIYGKLRVFIHFAFDNRRGSNSGKMNVEIKVNNWEVKITTTKTI